MSETTTQQPGDSGKLRDIPSDVGEYKKFVADGGLEHNEKILGHEAAVAAAKAAGIVPESETGDKAQEHKQRSGFQSRVARLQRKIGERDQRIADLEARLSSAPPAQNGTAAHAPASNGSAPAKAADHAPAASSDSKAGDKKAPPRPVEKDFKTYSEFIEALTDWKTARTLEAAEAKRTETARLAEAETKSKAITDAHNARVDEAKTRYPDWDKAFEGMNDNSFTDPMVVFIFESNRGPDVTYYLATHRDELERISKLSPLRQAAALGKIEDQFTTEEETDDEEEAEGERGAPEKREPPPAKKPPEPKPQPKRVSSAPPPAKPLGGKGGSDDPMPDPADFVKYQAWSKRQAARGVKR